jgi:hypothetical protein
LIPVPGVGADVGSGGDRGVAPAVGTATFGSVAVGLDGSTVVAALADGADGGGGDETAETLMIIPSREPETNPCS